MAEFDFAANRRLRLRRSLTRIPIASCASSVSAAHLVRTGRITDACLRVQNVIQTPHGSRATLKNIRHPTQRDHRKHQLAQEPIERPHGPYRKPMVDHVAPALTEQNYKRDPNQRGEKRKEQAPGSNQLDVAVHIIAIRQIESLDLR